jgi:hypothetical protein
VTCDDRAASFPLWGPCSGGGERVDIDGERVLVVAFGDAVPPDGQDVREYTPAAFVRAYGANPQAASAIAWLRARGLVEAPPGA